MALKIWDGFDHYDATADFLARSGFLQYAMPGVEQPMLTFVAGRVGGSAVQVYNSSLFLNSQLSAVWGDRNAEAFYGFAVYISGGSVNLPSAGVEYQLPFGGTKESSFGPKEQGPAALEFYSDYKTVYLKY